MRTTLTSLALIVPFALAAAPAAAGELGDHPAVVVQRLKATQGYDYASKFYPHPAWLYLLPEAPHRMNEHPAVLVFKREQRREQESLARARASMALVAQTPR
jgi:hypothetical protein